jgi:hypothetical protein
MQPIHIANLYKFRKNTHAERQQKKYFFFFQTFQYSKLYFIVNSTNQINSH